MKKITVLSFCFILMLGVMTGCGNKDNVNSATHSESEATDDKNNETTVTPNITGTDNNDDKASDDVGKNIIDDTGDVGRDIVDGVEDIGNDIADGVDDLVDDNNNTMHNTGNNR